MRITDTPIPAQLTIVAWPDPIVDALGFPPHDPYSEMTGREERFDWVVCEREVLQRRPPSSSVHSSGNQAHPGTAAAARREADRAEGDHVAGDRGSPQSRVTTTR